MYHDSSVLTKGPYKFKQFKNVPLSFFMNLYNNHPFEDQELLQYIQKRKTEGNIEGQKNNPVICDKYSFPSKETAKDRLNFLLSLHDNVKKPTRAYECEICGGWHLTSMPLSEYKTISNP